MDVNMSVTDLFRGKKKPARRLPTPDHVTLISSVVIWLASAVLAGHPETDTIIPSAFHSYRVGNAIYRAPIYQAPIYEAPIYEAPIYEPPIYEAPTYGFDPRPASTYWESSTSSTAPRFPGPRFPAPRPPASRPAASRFPAAGFPGPRNPAPRFPAPRFPAPHFPAPHFAAPHFKAPEFRVQEAPLDPLEPSEPNFDGDGSVTGSHRVFVYDGDVYVLWSSCERCLQNLRVRFD